MTQRILLLFTGVLDSKKGNCNLLTGTHYLKPCYESVLTHIIKPNINYKIDVLFYCWGTDIQIINNLIQLYNPILYKFTSVQLDNQFFSKMKGNKLAWELAQSLDTQNYKYCMFLRPDIIFFKPILFDTYNYNNIYHNDGRPDQGGHYGDFYFLMNNDNASHFASFFDKYYEEFKQSVWTEDIFRNTYLPLLSQYLSSRTEVCNDLRAGSAREIELYRVC